jgi:hypothetical protein
MVRLALSPFLFAYQDLEKIKFTLALAEMPSHGHGTNNLT